LDFDNNQPAETEPPCDTFDLRLRFLACSSV